MLIDVLGQLRWWDFVIVILLIRICYISIKMGLPVELFKLLGTLAAIYLSLHYYTFVSDLLSRSFSLPKAPLEFLDFVVLIVLAIAGYLVFMILRSILYRFLKLEATPNLNKWGGLFFGIIRGYFLAAFLSFALSIASVDYLRLSVRSSYLGSRIFSIAPDTYKWIWDTITSRFMDKEKFNQVVMENVESFRKTK